MRLIFFAFFEKIVVPILTSGGYVGLSLAVLLAQHHQVTALDIVPEKVEMMLVTAFVVFVLPYIAMSIIAKISIH